MQNDTSLQSELLRLVDHSMWANQQWIDFIYSQPNPETRPQKLLSHLMLSEKVWFDRITGDQKITDTFPLQSREEIQRGFEENRRIYKDLIENHLEAVIHFTRGSGEKYHSRVIDIIHMVLTHGYHHRGQMAEHYAKKGGGYPNTDHINYLIVNKL